ncbi:HTH-type transcriptional regulator DmlR [Variibacter gotjawalensis]|uniref:HTH-type transcriptional regulator DmlR n=1 Tax=Variibacter gotjawalensis TaxID=1333996 RepID=A0A0S3PUY5_9BRAD|nr:LysR family transcriptional regulator [Variibacter gotjawalensis]NIK50062.1 DNA-binding transcriptional LysR family regulator [Variibacter gotjawalensis]RZS46061.1 DNA-binding transcriptional LysR family regulator [Variibacter gotjawalensis]BAT59736.1 HTH-type transcriptional regulator DmlR [Variibacter gotjawalensis]
MKLPDLEALAIFATVVKARSFAGAAGDLGASKATVSKAVSRLEEKLGTRLFNRTSRRLALTDAGRRLAERAERILAEGEAAESDVQSESASPRGLVRVAAPLSFGIRAVAPLLPKFFEEYPDVSIDLQLSDSMVDLIGDGFDLALRISVLPDSSLVARRIADVNLLFVASPAYLKKHGRPTHPLQLAEHQCVAYTNIANPRTWRFKNARGEEATVRVNGPLVTNSGEAMTAVALAGQAITGLPDFLARDAIADGRLEVLLEDWPVVPAGLHLVMPPGGPRPARVEVLIAFLARELAKSCGEIARKDKLK